jgi:hypothetical protein
MKFINKIAKSVNDFNSKVYDKNGDPLVTMNSGGASWQNELGSIQEAKNDLSGMNCEILMRRKTMY